jgi:halocyanin-like protein
VVRCSRVTAAREGSGEDHDTNTNSWRASTDSSCITTAVPSAPLAPLIEQLRGPAAVRVDPGTTVVWEWTGNGGGHNVVAENGAFESETTSEAGHTFEYTLEESVIVKYACTPTSRWG